jgi:hypothetical protein
MKSINAEDFISGIESQPTVIEKLSAAEHSNKTCKRNVWEGFLNFNRFSKRIHTENKELYLQVSFSGESSFRGQV